MEAKKWTALFTAGFLLLLPTVSATVTSADIVEYQSEGSQFFDGPVILLSTTSNYDTNKFHFQLDNRDLQERLGVDGEVRDQITVEVTNQKTEAVYTLRDTGQTPVYKFEPLSGRIDIDDWNDYTEDEKRQIIETSRFQDQCYDISRDGEFGGDGIDYVYKTVFEGWTDKKLEVYCVKSGVPLGNVGEIASNPRDVFSTEWVARNGNGVIERATISNGDMGSSVTKQLGPNVKVMFSGAASTGRNSPTPTDEMVLHNNDDGFKIIERGEYRDYVNTIDVSQKLVYWAKGQIPKENVVGDLNTKAVEAADQHDSSEFVPESGTSDSEVNVTGRDDRGSSLGNGEIRLQIGKLLYPEYTVAARACRHQPGDTCNAFVRIEKTVGVPEIISSSGTEFSELQPGEASVTYENVGETAGRFEARVAQCGGSFSWSGIAEVSRVDAGDTRTEYLPISFSTTDTSQSTFSNQCTLQVKELTTGETVSTTVNVEASQENDCTPDKKFRDWEVVTEDGENLKKYTVYKCNSTGTDATEVKTCDPGDVAEPQTDGSYQCVNNGGGDTEICGNNVDDDGDGKTDENCSNGCSPIVLVSNPVGKGLTIPNIPCQFNKAVSGAWGAVKTAAAIFAFLIGYGLRVPAMRLAKISNPVVQVADHKFKMSWIVGIVFGLILSYGTLTFLSNPVIKWTFIILGSVGTGLYLYLFGPGSLVRALLPI